MLKTILVIPCFNEAERFPREVIRDFLHKHANLSLVLVNDGSRDQTETMLDGFRQGFPERVQVIQRRENKGKAETVREGILYALRLSPPADVIGFWDADLATPLEEVLEMLKVLEAQPKIQMVFGSRVKLLGRRVQRRMLRHYLGRLFATSVSMMLRLPVYDTQCGSKLFRFSSDLQQLFQQPFISRWIFDVEIIARWIQLNRFDIDQVSSTIYEYPLHQWEDVGGSKVRPHHFLLAFLDLVHIWWHYLVGKR